MSQNTNKATLALFLLLFIHYLAMFCLFFPEKHIRMAHYNILMEVNSKTNEVAHGIKGGFNYERCGLGCLAVEIAAV